MTYLRIIIIYLTLFLFDLSSAYSQRYEQWNSAEIYEGIKKLSVLGSALYIAAHPDDENTGFIAYLAKDRKMRAAYISLTRGDGGQNRIGPEIRESLGIIRTQELLKARSVDQGLQFFSRANDFGFSKNAEETFTIWDKEKVLSDLVWTIRKFQPDVLITRFPHTPAPTHGHHTASAQLAYEAFDLAGDATAFPDQLKYVKVWQPKRLVFNTSWRMYGSKADFEAADKSDLLKVDVGAYYPAEGKSNSEIAAISRSQHQCQAMGTAQERGQRMEYLKHLKGVPATSDLFDNIDTKWTRISGGNKLKKLLTKIEKQYQLDQPEKSIPDLISAKNIIQHLPNGIWKEAKLEEINHLIQQCLALYVEVSANEYAIHPGQKITVDIELTLRAKSNVNLSKIDFLGVEKMEKKIDENLKFNQPFTLSEALTVNKNTAISIPYWLKKKPQKGMYVVDDQKQIGHPQNSNELFVSLHLMLENQPIRIDVPITYKWLDPVVGERVRNVAFAPSVSVNLKEKMFIFANEKPQNIDVVLKSYKDNAEGIIKVQIPENWSVEPSEIKYNLLKKGDEKQISLNIFPPESGQSSGNISFEEKGKSSLEKIEIEYDHIPHQLFFNEVKGKLVKLDLKKTDKKIAYLMGAGDKMPESLRQIGYQVNLFKPEEINRQSLKEFDVMIMGIRAYNTEKRLPFLKEILMDFVNEGGTMIVQYNTSFRLVTEDIGPYPLSLSKDRVTVEEAPVTILNPKHKVLNYPNKITAKDFDHWVQERGLYFPNQWDEKYEAIFSINDPGENPKQGALLIAPYGKGHFVYTGISWFRQLPAGVPGAFRIFTNLIEIDNEP